MLSWHYYAVLLVPGLGLAADHGSRLLILAALVFFAGLVALAAIGGIYYAACLWLVTHLACIALTHRTS